MARELKIINPRGYKKWRIQLSVNLLVFSGVTIGYFVLRHYVTGVLVFATLLLSGWRIGRESLVTQVELINDEIVVHYYQWFRWHKATMPIAVTSVSDPCEPTYILELLGIHRLYLEDASQTFCLSTSDGFSPQQLRRLYDELVDDESNT